MSNSRLYNKSNNASISNSFANGGISLINCIHCLICHSHLSELSSKPERGLCVCILFYYIDFDILV